MGGNVRKERAGEERLVPPDSLIDPSNPYTQGEWVKMKDLKRNLSHFLRHSLRFESYQINSLHQHPFKKNSKVQSLNNVWDAIRHCLPTGELRRKNKDIQPRSTLSVPDAVVLKVIKATVSFFYGKKSKMHW